MGGIFGYQVENDVALLWTGSQADVRYENATLSKVRTDLANDQSNHWWWVVKIR
jgi:hypothetical protein